MVNVPPVAAPLEVSIAPPALVKVLPVLLKFPPLVVIGAAMATVDE